MYTEKGLVHTVCTCAENDRNSSVFGMTMCILYIYAIYGIHTQSKGFMQKRILYESVLLSRKQRHSLL